ncbi:Uncharacterized protein ToN1_09350 [Aromatoleum petrolei]|nr:Uncharacterized protein ToN1_09350 [Aromatoleum petrolei]
MGRHGVQVSSAIVTCQTLVRLVCTPAYTPWYDRPGLRNWTPEGSPVLGAQETGVVLIASRVLSIDARTTISNTGSSRPIINKGGEGRNARPEDRTRTLTPCTL